MKCRLFNKTVRIFFLLSFLLSSSVFSIKFFPGKRTSPFDRFQNGVCHSIESSAQSGGLFRDQNGFRRQDYRNTIREGIISFFHNAGASFFSEIRKKSYAYSKTLFDGLLASITSGRSITQNALRAHFRKKEHRKAIQESVIKERKKIISMTWKEGLKFAAKWGIPYAVITAGLLGSLSALRFYHSDGDSEGLKAFWRLFIPSITTGYYLAKRGLRNGFKRSLLINGAILGGSILFKGLKSYIFKGF